MFKKKNAHQSKPDPPDRIEPLLFCLILVCCFGFGFSVSTLNSINENLRHEETNHGVPLPELPIYQPLR